MEEEAINSIAAEFGAVPIHTLSMGSVEAFERLRKAQDESYRLHTVMGAWERAQEAERQLRTTYGTWIMAAVIAQLVIIQVLVFLLGLGIVSFERWTVELLIVSIFLEVTALVRVVMRDLFPNNASRSLELLRTLREL